MKIWRLHCLCGFTAMLLSVSACDHQPVLKDAPMDLAPHDKRPVLSVSVEDPIEIALLEQVFHIRPLYVRGNTLYFRADESVPKRLNAIGYDPAEHSPHEVEQRVVRVFKRGAESDLLATGVELINREADYWIVRGSLRDLRTLGRLGYQLAPIGRHEPQVREIRVVVPTREHVQRVNALHVDIFSVQETPSGFVITGGAYDAQIDELRKRAYTVEILSRY